jgi:hypothetical protein
MTPRQKNLIETLITPLCITIVGAVLTYAITKQQIRSAEICARAEIQTKLLDIFNEKITGNNPDDQTTVLRIVEALDPTFARTLANVVVKTTKDSSVRGVADDILKDSYVIVAAYNKLEYAQKFADNLLTYQLQDSIKIYQTEKQVYAVTYGGAKLPKDAYEAFKLFTSITNKKFKDTYVGKRRGIWTNVSN